MADMVSIPITVEQLILAVQQLQPNERAQVARALVQLDLQSDLTALIQELYAQPPVEEVTDADIMAEIKAVCQQSNKTGMRSIVRKEQAFKIGVDWQVDPSISKSARCRTARWRG